MDTEKLEQVKIEAKKELSDLKKQLKSINQMQEDMSRKANCLNAFLKSIDDMIEYNGD